MTDDEILGRVLRRFLTDEDEWSSLAGTDLVLDGRIRLTDEEAAAIERAQHKDEIPPRRVREGETFDLAPHEKAQVVRDIDGAGALVLLSVDGGPFGVKGCRIG